MRGRSSFPPMTFPESVRGWQSTWFYCRDIPTPGQSTGLPPFSLERLRTPRSLTVEEEEKGEVAILVDAVVALVRGGVTGMDLLEVFLSRRIQPLQARDHPMWLYLGTEDTARTHPEEVQEDTVAQWLRSITGNKDNPRGAKRILPFDAEHPPGEVFTKMYSPVPNGEQYLGGVESEDGSVDIEHADNSEDDSDDSEDSEEVESPPRSERRTK